MPSRPFDIPATWRRVRAACCDDSPVDADQHAWAIVRTLLALRLVKR